MMKKAFSELLQSFAVPVGETGQTQGGQGILVVGVFRAQNDPECPLLDPLQL